VGARFSAPVQIGPGAHKASCTMGTGSFPGVKRPGRGADHPPPSSAGLSWPVLGRPLPLCSISTLFYVIMPKREVINEDGLVGPKYVGETK
jgi:hypothetical protein